MFRSCLLTFAALIVLLLAPASVLGQSPVRTNMKADGRTMILM